MLLGTVIHTAWGAAKSEPTLSINNRTNFPIRIEAVYSQTGPSTSAGSYASASDIFIVGAQSRVAINTSTDSGATLQIINILPAEQKNRAEQASLDFNEKQAILEKARSQIGKTEINPLWPSLEDDELSPILTIVHEIKEKYTNNENDKKYLEETSAHYLLRSHKTNSEMKQMGECNLYKIHLMPNTYNLEFVYDIVTLMEKDEALRNAFSYKILKPSFYRKNQPFLHATQWGDKEIVADIVIYFEGKEKAQAGLNSLYRATKNIEGSGFRPRFNAQVNDFIWVAQGNADDKYPGKKGYDENTIYCSYPETVDHRLKHPETGEDLISFTEKPITDDMLTNKDTQANLSEDDFNNS